MRAGLIKKAAAPAAAALALVGAGGGWALAAGSGGPVIHACANKRSHVLRLVRRCKRNETGVSWNRRGPQGPTGTVNTANFYTKAQSDSRYLPVGAGATGQSAVYNQGWTPPTLSAVRQVTVDVGPTARHALIEADGDLFSNPNTSCSAYVQLSYNGQAQQSTNTAATAPDAGSGNGYGTFTTSAMPLLSAGTQVITLSGVVTSGCVFEDARLNVVLLSN